MRDVDPVRVSADTDLADAAVLMSDHNLITIPVVDERRHVIGILTADDLLKAPRPGDWCPCGPHSRPMPAPGPAVTCLSNEL